MWENIGWPMPNDYFDLNNIQDIYYYDGPLVFTCKDRAGAEYLAYAADRNAEADMFVVVPFDRACQEMLDGSIQIRDALVRTEVFVLEWGSGSPGSRVWRASLDDLPAGVIPEAGVFFDFN